MIVTMFNYCCKSDLDRKTVLIRLFFYKSVSYDEFCEIRSFINKGAHLSYLGQQRPSLFYLTVFHQQTKQHLQRNCASLSRQNRFNKSLRWDVTIQFANQNMLSNIDHHSSNSLRKLIIIHRLSKSKSFSPKNCSLV